MDYFHYKNGIYHAEDVPLPKIAEAVGTPFYCYSSATFTRHFNVLKEAFAAIPTTICYAVKANSNLAVLKLLAGLGAGADTVSEGEIRRAVAAGIPVEKVVFSGVGKTRDEMRYALSLPISQFNVESLEELEQLNEVAASMGVIAPVAVRVNPDVVANTHEKITTGRKEDKFGIPYDMAPSVYARAAELPHIKVQGITTHIGSQLTSLEPFRKAFQRVVSLVEQLKAAGHAIEVVDLGGGLGIPYAEEAPPSPAEYAQMIIKEIQHLGCRLELEPGRVIAGNAGILVSSLLYMKRTPHREFAVIDAAMNDLMRPAMYGSHHNIFPVQEGKPMQKADIVGPVCETSDVFTKQADIPDLKPDDLVAIRSAGAYGAVMSGTYNTRLLIPEVLVEGDKFAVIRPRQTYEELLGLDQFADWQ